MGGCGGRGSTGIRVSALFLALIAYRFESWAAQLTMHTSRYRFFGPLCLNIFADIRPQASLGIHLCLVPLYLDLHVLWFIVSLMSRARGLELQQADRDQWPFVFGEDYD